MSDKNIERGQLWETTAGKKADIVFIKDNGGTYPVLAMVEGEDDVLSYTSSGSYYNSGDGSPYDLVRPWRDKIEFEAAMVKSEWERWKKLMDENAGNPGSYPYRNGRLDVPELYATKVWSKTKQDSFYVRVKVTEVID